MPFELECDWFDACTRPAVGMAGHPIHGVIPICAEHVRQDRVPLITSNESEH